MIQFYLLSTVILIIVLFALQAFLHRVLDRHNDRDGLKAIPSPPQSFLIGNLPIILYEPDQLFLKLRALAKEFYPIYKLEAFYVTIVNILDPRDVELVLSSTKHLSKSKIYTYLYNWLGTGLLTSTGSKWHKRRKILTPTFHFSILQQFVHVFNDETTRLVEDLRKDCGKIIGIVPPITHFTLRSIGETAMGFTNIDETVQKDYQEAIYKMGNILFQRLSKPWYRIDWIYNLSPLWFEERKTVKILHDFSENIIKNREMESQKNISPALEGYSRKKRFAMLDLLLATKTQNADIDHEGIREEVDTFMFEGHDTTAMAISYILLCLANHPDIQSKVVSEILNTIGPNNPPSVEDLQNLRYTERCIKETLRLFPSVPLISRYAGEDLQTKTGYSIPKGTVLHIHIFDIHRCSALYPDPLKFDPDRFLPEAVNQRHPFAYIPFSAGPRNCIGQKYAFLELKAVLCGILRNFILEKEDDLHSIEFKPDLVLRPTNDIRIRLLPRS